MSKLKDLTGQKFGRLTVLYKLNNYHKRGAYWLCVCKCGNLKEVFGRDLRRGSTRSCGCLQRDITSKIHTKHGKHNTRLYHIYYAMKNRCYNKDNNRYQYYGKRGIVVCDEWLNDFQAFYEWAMNNNYKENLTIDRIDPNGNYTPDNCRWADIATQNRNTRQNRYIKYSKVLQRIIKLNWPIEKAFTTK